MGQMTISIRGEPVITLPISTPAEIEKLERRFGAFAAKIGMDRAAFAKEMVLAIDALGLDPKPIMKECQICGLLYFGLNIPSTVPARPGRLADYISAWNFEIDLDVNQRAERIAWHVEATADRPN